ncbi:ras guanine nucleotide exchange factor domain-containing protein, partial [Cladochytrium replicatum]
ADMEFTKAFLMLYRKFMRPSELLDRLMDRFDAYDVKDPVCNVLIHWLTDYWCDLHTEKMRFTLHVFLQICMSRPSFAQIYNRLAPLVFRDPPTEEEKLSVDWGIPDPEDDPAEVLSTMSEDESIILRSVPDSTHAEVGTMSGTNQSHQSQGRRWITNVFGMNREVDAGSTAGSGTNSPATPMSTGLPMMMTVPVSVANATSFLNTPFLELDNYVIAQQLNLMEFEIFSRIKPRDFLQHIWSRRLKGRHAPAVAASIGHFNFISAWVATRVLSQKKLKNRSKMLSKFMKIAQILREANNYNTLMAIIAGINSHPIFRLKQTRRLIENKASFKQYEVLQDLMGMHHGFANYRAALKTSEMPCIPYLGLFLKDLLYTDEVNKDRKPDGTINLPKFLLMGDIIMMVKSFQVR